jgi:hypothetical protein
MTLFRKYRSDQVVQQIEEGTVSGETENLGIAHCVTKPCFRGWLSLYLQDKRKDIHSPGPVR